MASNVEDSNIQQMRWKKALRIQARNQLAACLMIVSWIWLTLQPWRWWLHVLPKGQWIFTGLHDVISQKTELHIYMIYIQDASIFFNRWILFYCLFHTERISDFSAHEEGISSGIMGLGAGFWISSEDISVERM
jgi:hypothetical protein